MHFASLDVYLRDGAGRDPAACLPVALVARWIGVTPPAVKLMLKRGELEAVSIGRAQFVSAASLRAWQAMLEADLQKLRKVMVKAARKGTPLAYSEVLVKLGRDYANPADRRRIGRLMVALSDLSLAEDGVLLAAMAYSKQTGLPKHGVWEHARTEGWFTPATDNPAAFVDTHRARLAEVYAK